MIKLGKKNKKPIVWEGKKDMLIVLVDDMSKFESYIKKKKIIGVSGVVDVEDDETSLKCIKKMVVKAVMHGLKKEKVVK